MRCLVTASTTGTVLDQSIGAAQPEVAHVAAAASVERCDVCAHPLAEHDRIARRYCVATFASAVTRGCICS
jgi:hypothetical protein